jgi:hypothetical protein
MRTESRLGQSNHTSNPVYKVKKLAPQKELAYRDPN